VLTFFLVKLLSFLLAFTIQNRKKDGKIFLGKGGASKFITQAAADVVRLVVASAHRGVIVYLDLQILRKEGLKDGS
jgi:hypothetical protein